MSKEKEFKLQLLIEKIEKELKNIINAEDGYIGKCYLAMTGDHTSYYRILSKSTCNNSLVCIKVYVGNTYANMDKAYILSEISIKGLKEITQSTFRIRTREALEDILDVKLRYHS